MIITAISDTHGMHGQVKLPGGDLLIHAGDTGENKGDTRSFLRWLHEQDYALKIFIAGNHDRYIEERLDDFMGYVNHYPTVKYLEHESTSFEGINIFGSPYSQNLPRWSFQLPHEREVTVWKKIPNNTDILITHGPAYGIGDKLDKPRLGEDPHSGDKALLNKINNLNIKYHIFGHIHEGYGTYKDRHINASCADIDYNLINPPITLEI